MNTKQPDEFKEALVEIFTQWKRDFDSCILNIPDHDDTPEAYGKVVAEYLIEKLEEL